MSSGLMRRLPEARTAPAWAGAPGLTVPRGSVRVPGRTAPLAERSGAPAGGQAGAGRAGARPGV